MEEHPRVSVQQLSDNKSGSIQKRRHLWPPVILLGTLRILLIASYSNRWLAVSGQTVKAGLRQPVPQLDFPQLNGGRWRLNDHRGQVVFLNFWATWCPPCRAETLALVKISEHYRSECVAFAGVSMDDDLEAVHSFVQSFHVSYPVLLPSQHSHLADTVESLPTSLLLDREGRVARSYVGSVSEHELSRDIEQLLREGQSPSGK